MRKLLRGAVAGPRRPRYPVGMLKDLWRKAQEAAERHLPDSVREGGRKLAEQVLERAPASLQSRARALLQQTEAEAPEAPVEPAIAGAESAAPAAAPEVDEREQGSVVVFGYPEDAATDRVAALLAAEGVEHRRMNLHQQPQAAKQIAAVTGVMSPPYVYIRGRFWGGEGEIESLRGLGELHAVVAGRLAELSDEARRIGKLREEFDDALSADNILLRLRRGHILSVDDLDCWYETGPDGQARFYYEGAPRPVEDMEAVAREIAGRAEAEGLTAQWRFEPAVSV